MSQTLLTIRNGNDELTIFKEDNYFFTKGFVEGLKKDSVRQIFRSIQLPNEKEWRIVEGTSSSKEIFLKMQLSLKSLYSGPERILDIYSRLLTKERINLEEATVEYGVHRETIKEDISAIRNIYSPGKESVKIKNGEYFLQDTHLLSAGDAFILIQMLYQTNSLNKEELKEIKGKIISSFSKEEQRQLEKFFGNYDLYYKSANSNKQLEVIEKIFRAVNQKNIINFEYRNAKGKKSKRELLPLTIVLHDKMYYLIGEMEEEELSKTKTFRLDRINNLKVLEKRIIKTNNNRFESGEFLEESFNMFGGERVHVRLRIHQDIEEYLLRKVPNAVKLKKVNDWLEYEVIVRGTEGILLWILSQREYIEVLAPLKLREEIKAIINNLTNLYNK